jgi:hypothetical protein
LVENVELRIKDSLGDIANYHCQFVRCYNIYNERVATKQVS